MGKIITMTPVRSIRGKISKSDDLFFSERYGQTVITRVVNPYRGPSTAKQQSVRTKFRSVSQQVQAELSDEAGVAKWKALFKRQKKYRTLRGMVFAKLYEQAQSATE
ncbi:MAG: hypothetical protein ACI30H_00805 [Paludibacteraceae bacterium]